MLFVINLEQEPKSTESSLKPTEDEVPGKFPAEQKVILTDKEMNELAAKIMKAEIVGNDVSCVSVRSSLKNTKLRF